MYLKKLLIDDLNESFFQRLNSYLFQGKPLEKILHDYEKVVNKSNDKDSDGKTLYGILLENLRTSRKDRDDLVDAVMEFAKENEKNEMEHLENYLTKEIVGIK